MKAGIDESGFLVITAETAEEAYALGHWTGRSIISIPYGGPTSLSSQFFRVETRIENQLPHWLDSGLQDFSGGNAKEEKSD